MQLIATCTTQSSTIQIILSADETVIMLACKVKEFKFV